MVKLEEIEVGALALCGYIDLCYGGYIYGGILVIVGFIDPGSLGDRLPRQGLAQTSSTQLMGRPKSLKQWARRAV